MLLIVLFPPPAEFAEMQLNITDIKRDLVSTGIPYHSYQSYTQYILFPKEVEAATIASLLEHSGVCIHMILCFHASHAQFLLFIFNLKSPKPNNERC